MVDKLSVIIALEGGALIQQQLKDVGEAGKKAFGDILTAAEKVGGFKNLKPEELSAKFKELGITSKDAIDKITSAVQHAMLLETVVGVVAKVEGGFASAGAAAIAFGRVFGPIGVAAATAGVAVVKSVTAMAEAIRKVDAEAIKLGLSIKQFEQLRQGMQAAGLGAKAVESGMSAIGKAREQAKLIEVTKEVTDLQNQLKVGLGGVGLSQFAKLMDMAQGIGAPAEAAKKALADFGISVEPATKSLAEFIAKFGGDTTRGVAAFVEQLRTMPDSANRTERAVAGLSDAGVALVQGFRAGTVPLDLFKERIGGLTADAVDASVKVDAASNRLSTAWGNMKTALEAKLVINFGPTVTAALDGITAALQANAAQWEDWSITAAKWIADLILKLLDLPRAITAAITGAAWNAFSSAAVTAFQTIIGWVDVLIEKMKLVGSSILTKGTLGGGGGDAIPGNAAGGLIGGRGSGTSDSNLAFVSRGEHIMPASVVRQPGVLALLEALRTGSGMGRFALGGVVPGLPRFADGGLVGHLGTVDLRTDHGSVRLMAGSSAVDQLSRLAVTRRMTSTGRKPGFVG
jgi:hypothetical protein